MYTEVVTMHDAAFMFVVRDAEPGVCAHVGTMVEVSLSRHVLRIRLGDVPLNLAERAQR